MEILWLAIVFYSIGLGIILYLRPAIMFHPDGSWKEFGYGTHKGPLNSHTMFPFWLFSLAWAFGSYALAATVIWRFMPAESMAVGALGLGSSLGSSLGSGSSSVLGMGTEIGVTRQNSDNDQEFIPRSEMMYVREAEFEAESEAEAEAERRGEQSGINVIQSAI